MRKSWVCATETCPPARPLITLFCPTCGKYNPLKEVIKDMQNRFFVAYIDNGFLKIDRRIGSMYKRVYAENKAVECTQMSGRKYYVIEVVAACKTEKIVWETYRDAESR